MTEPQAEYFRKSGTQAPSQSKAIDLPNPTSTPQNTIETKIGSSPRDDLISQNMIKLDKYRKIRATRKVIAHVHFEPD